MNIHFKRGLIFSILGMVAFAAFYAYMDKWGGGTVRTTYLTFTPDWGWVMPLSYNRWLDVLFWPAAMTLVFWLAYGASETMNKEKRNSTGYWCSLAAGAVLVIAFHLLIGRAILPNLAICFVVGAMVNLMTEITGKPRNKNDDEDHDEAFYNSSEIGSQIAIMYFGFVLGIGIMGGILSYGILLGLVISIVLAICVVAGAVISEIVLVKFDDGKTKARAN